MWGMQFSLLRKSFTVSENHKHFHKRDFFFTWKQIKSALWHFYVVMKEQQSYRRKIIIPARPDRADRLNR